MTPAQGITLLRFRSPGLVLATDSVLPFKDTSVMNELNKDYFLNTTHSYTYMDNQRLIWRHLNRSVVNHPPGYDSLLTEFVHYLGSSKRSAPFYTITKEGTHITIQADNIPFDPQTKDVHLYNEDGMHYFMLADILAELKPKLSESKHDFTAEFHFSNDSTLDSLAVKGKFLGAVPVSLTYTTKQKIKLIASFSENTPVLKTGEMYPLKISLLYDMGEQDKRCPFSPLTRLLLTVTTGEMLVNGCGLAGSARLEDLYIGL